MIRCLALKIMKLKLIALFAIFSAATLSAVASVHAQEKARVYVSWYFGRAPNGSSTYLIACDKNGGNDPFLNDCIDINAFNKDVSGRSNEVITNLISGEEYRICLTADNNPRVGRGRWNTCYKGQVYSGLNLTIVQGEMKYIKSQP
jgi:hypothetical protein